MKPRSGSVLQPKVAVSLPCDLFAIRHRIKRITSDPTLPAATLAGGRNRFAVEEFVDERRSEPSLPQTTSNASSSDN